MKAIFKREVRSYFNSPVGYVLSLIHILKCYEIPEGSRASRGMNIKNLLPLQPEEKISSMILSLIHI